MILSLKLRNTAYSNISDFSYLEELRENKITLVSKNTYERGTLNQLVNGRDIYKYYTIDTYKSRNFALWS